jgi:hypothetical protein
MNLYYNTETDSRAWVIELVWDTPEDAAEFRTSYGDFLLARLPDSETVESCHQTAQETICLLGVDDTTVIISYAPDAALAQQLMNQ